MTKEEGQVPIGMVDVKNLTDSELQEQLIKHGYHPGPIISSTRQVYEDKLLQLLTYSSPSTQHKVKKTEEPHQDLESEEDKENFDDIVLKRSIKISQRTRRPKKENPALQKSAKEENYEIEECGSPSPLHSKELPSVYSVDGDVDIYYPDPSSHTGIRITIRRPLKTKREDPRTILEEKEKERKIGVISIAFIISVWLIFTLILFVYLTMEKEVIEV
ncbi:LEM domain-containing protein 1 [Trichosurus vulpecula]|uniref:LEM domain-containing protein 1 n=1 Tax=Trichosurus vulpecula TaxID=9337 RepID=UPI00186B477E|nr:LEM domain-containing protein 1 [Trichosurus vulpecula]